MSMRGAQTVFSVSFCVCEVKNLNEQEVKTLIEEGAAYVEEYLREGRGKHVDIESIKEVIDIYHDYLLLTNVLEVKE